MEMDENSLIEHLKMTNSEFRQLREEHLQYEQQLEEFNKLRFLTSEQELEKKTPAEAETARQGSHGGYCKGA